MHKYFQYLCTLKNQTRKAKGRQGQQDKKKKGREEGTKGNTQKIHYLCNGEKKDCNKRICHKTIGDCELACKHTKDVRYAKNFSKRIPQVKASGYWEQEAAPDDRAQPEN